MGELNDVIASYYRLRDAVQDVINQDLFPDPRCPDNVTGCLGCLEDALEGKRRLVAALATGPKGEADAS